MTRYRYPSEIPILTLTMAVVGGVFLLSAGLTVCLAPLLLGVVVLIAYLANKSHTRALIQQAVPVSAESTPALAQVTRFCLARLKPGRVQVFLVRNRALNAYTFGLEEPYNIVLFSPLLQVMDADELRFIVGHEMGHVALGHTWLNSLLGGMAGVPTNLGLAVILVAAFRWWNRACEYSADRAGLLACGSLQKATSALVHLVAGHTHTPADLERALRSIEAEDDSFANVFAETFSTHPMLVRRIEELRRWAATSEYRALQARVNQIPV
jgi:Zn-dependent protease with chaperone function